jgi:hypothetical protein
MQCARNSTSTVRSNISGVTFRFNGPGLNEVSGLISVLKMIYSTFFIGDQSWTPVSTDRCHNSNENSQ